MTNKLNELHLLETRVRAIISELRLKGYSDDEISKFLDRDETYKKFDKLYNQILDELS